jgi:NAD(P)-dependent dehydrogenase (short-subunit alcohol dehydrogenase family)
MWASLKSVQRRSSPADIACRVRRGSIETNLCCSQRKGKRILMERTGRLAGKVALVTGAGSGFGEAAALRFAAEGASVSCVDVDAEAAKHVADKITADGGRGVGLSADVSSAADCQQMVADTAREFGEINVLFANAGIAGAGTAVELAEEDWDRVLGVNLKGVWLSAKYVLPAMVRRGHGSIVNTASIGGLVGVKGTLPYATAKGGVISMTKQMAADFSPYGVRINAICPSSVVTPLVRRTYAERAANASDPEAAAQEAMRQMARKHPMGHMGTVEDVANLALFLASDESGWITGSAMTVDGGYTAI